MLLLLLNDRTIGGQLAHRGFHSRLGGKSTWISGGESGIAGVAGYVPRRLFVQLRRGQHVGSRVLVGHARPSSFGELRLIDNSLGGILAEELIGLEEGDLGRSVRALLQGKSVLHAFQVLLITGAEGDTAGRDYSVGGAHLDDESYLLVLVLASEGVV